MGCSSWRAGRARTSHPHSTWSPRTADTCGYPRHISAAPANILGLFSLTHNGARIESHPPAEEAEADPLEEDGDDPVSDEDDGEGGEEGVPPPQHQVDLLVDDVLHRCHVTTATRHVSRAHLCQHAQPVVDLLAAGRPHVGDVAGGDGGEDGAHRVPGHQRVTVTATLYSGIPDSTGCPAKLSTLGFFHFSRANLIQS